MAQARAARRRFATVTAAGLALTSCMMGGDGLGSNPTSDEALPLIGAFPAGDAKLDAVGALAVVMDADKGGRGELIVVCSGTLIDADTVVTAKHCLDAPSDFGTGHRLVFVIGADARVPKRVVEVLGMEGAPHDHGGYTGYGTDIGVVHLAEEVTDVAPMRIAGVTDAMVGRSLVTVGYGAMDQSQPYEKRRAGTLKLKARTGPTYEALLGSFEAFYEYETHRPLPVACDTGSTDQRDVTDVLRDRVNACEQVATVRAIYDSYRLEQTGELAAGGEPTDVQPCFGDSGGPLALPGPDGALNMVAVTSGGLSSRTLECAFGSVYASFSPQVLTFLRTAMQWRDPCGGVPAEGQCLGNTARRCSGRYEGQRRMLSLDCASLGTTCQAQPNGKVGCGLGPNEDAADSLVSTTPASVKDGLAFGRRAFFSPGARLSGVSPR